MTEEQTCGVCGQNTAVTKCSECAVPLCETCVQEVIIEQISPATTHKGITTSTMRPAVEKKQVCKKCLKEVDLL